jgi:uncharacterized membrane protein
MMLLISIFFSLFPLTGIGFMAANGFLLSVDGLFMSLILLTISGIFLLNAVLEARARGLLRGKTKPAPAKAAAQKAS